MKIEISDFVGQPCKSRVAFEFIPKTDYKLDLEKISRNLRNEVFIEIETPYLIMLKTGGKDISFFKSGKIIVKSTYDKHEAQVIAKNLLEKINKIK